MAIVQSMGGLEMISPTWQPGMIRRSLSLYDNFNFDYAGLYRTQPNVRTCVDFLARNVAQLGLHVFRRVSDTDRVRLIDHGLPQVLSRPLPPEFKVTRYRLIESLMSDLGIYFNAYWLKVRSGEEIGLLRIPPMYVTPKGGLAVSEYEVNIGGKMKKFSPAEMIHFRGYNPENAAAGLSPLETLRRVLAEEHSAGTYRQGFWRNAARISGIIQRPADAPEWSEAARERFRQEFKELYAGETNSGETAVLEEGMTWQPNTFNAKDSEYLAGRKLTREECARAYHIPLPLVGILDHATFSNIQEQHKNLYQDTLGPWLAMVEQDIELQLLPEFEDSAGVYCEFNIQEKMKGSFEDQTKAMQAAIGRPWMTADEGRARMNMPSLGGDAAQLVTPLNVLIGGQASPQDSAPKTAGGFERKAFDSHSPELIEQHRTKWTQELTRHYRRQEAAIVSRVDGANSLSVIWFDGERWDNELGADLFKLNLLTAAEFARRLAEQLESDVSEDAMLPWLQEHSRIQAEGINRHTRDSVGTALLAEEPLAAVKDVFTLAATVWAVQQATTATTTAASFGTTEAAKASGALTQKTWRVNSGNPRDAHAIMNGETVGIRENFSNGMKWPGDPAGGPDNLSNCQCSVEFN